MSSPRRPHPLVTIRMGATHNDMVVAGTEHPIPLKAKRSDRSQDAAQLCQALGIKDKPEATTKKKAKRRWYGKPKGGAQAHG